MSTLVKICGITRAEDAHEAVRLGAFAIGFIFQAKSPRYITPDAARVIADTLPASVVKVGVFVDQPADVVQAAVERAGVDVAQLHGEEGPTLCTASARRVWKALRVSQASDAERTHLVEQAEAYRACEALLIDALSPKGHGGTGERSDWTVAAELATKHRVILAGGLSPQNVAEAIRAVHPYAIDVSSGVEDAPGRKNFEKMAALFDQVNLCKVTSSPVSVR